MPFPQRQGVCSQHGYLGYIGGNPPFFEQHEGQYGGYQVPSMKENMVQNTITYNSMT
jgi:hypothetical protein